MAHGKTDKQLQELLERGKKAPGVEDGFRIFQEAVRRVPAPTMVNTGHVRFSTGANK